MARPLSCASPLQRRHRGACAGRQGHRMGQRHRRVQRHRAQRRRHLASPRRVHGRPVEPCVFHPTQGALARLGFFFCERNTQGTSEGGGTARRRLRGRDEPGRAIALERLAICRRDPMRLVVGHRVTGPGFGPVRDWPASLSRSRRRKKADRAGGSPCWGWFWNPLTRERHSSGS